MLRTMSPDQIRQMNPMMKNFTDAQIRMAASQMEMMATNPAMMSTAAEQMKNMSQSELDSLQRNGLGGGAGGAAAAAAAAGGGGSAFPSSQYGTVPSPGMPGGQITPEQMRQAQDQMANMSPEQLRQQAAMLKSMTPAQIRQMNPAMAAMSDAQIQQSAAQLEMMANNPEMMKMAKEQMAGMSAEDLKELQECQSALFGSDGAGGDGGSGIPTDPSQMDPSKMDPAAVKKMMKVLKKNPSMVKQMMASQPGMAGATDGMSDEQISAMIDKFDGMSEEQVKMVMGVMGKAQKILGPVTAGYRKANNAVGGQLGKIILFLIAFLIIRFIMSRMSGSVPNDISYDDAVGAMVKETLKAAGAGVARGEQDEFAEEL